MAPDLKDETTVYFILPGYQSLRPAERTPLTAIWEASGALRVLYGKDTLVGEVAFPDLDPPGSLSFQQNGVVYPMHASPTPYNRTIFMIYDGSPRHLRLVENLQSEFKLNWAVTGYSPNSRIINDQPKTDLRWLITR